MTFCDILNECSKLPENKDAFRQLYFFCFITIESFMDAEYLFEIITNGCVNYEQFINTCKLFFDINRIEKIEAYIKQKLESYIYTDIDFNECNLTDTVQYYCKKTGRNRLLLRKTSTILQTNL